MAAQYPFTGWVLGGTFIPKQVEVFGPRWSHDKDWIDTSGKVYHISDIHLTKAEAIAQGMRKIAEQEQALEKRKEGIAKKRANLEKHA